MPIVDPSGNLYPAMIKLSLKVTTTYCNVSGGYAYAELTPATVASFGVLVPADGHSPLVLGSVVGAD